MMGWILVIAISGIGLVMLIALVGFGAALRGRKRGRGEWW